MVCCRRGAYRVRVTGFSGGIMNSGMFAERARGRALRYLIAAALATVGAQTAQAACIERPVAAAARLHEFEMMMMDVSLRCARVGVSMQAEYNTMVAANQGQFDAAEGQLKQFFASMTDPEQRHGTPFDRYTTMLANTYGAGNTSIEACRQFAAVTAAVANASDGGETLNTVVMGLVQHPMLERATCPVAP